MKSLKIELYLRLLLISCGFLSLLLYGVSGLIGVFFIILGFLPLPFRAGRKQRKIGKKADFIIALSMFCIIYFGYDFFEENLLHLLLNELIIVFLWGGGIVFLLFDFLKNPSKKSIGDEVK